MVEFSIKVRLLLMKKGIPHCSQYILKLLRLPKLTKSLGLNYAKNVVFLPRCSQFSPVFWPSASQNRKYHDGE